jgi:arylformamidase
MREYLSQDWREWPIEKLENEYSPSGWAKHPYSEYAQLFQNGSEHARRTLGSQLKIDSYGSRKRNLIVWALPTSRQEIFVWIHGGYWQESSIEEALIGVEGLVEQGFGFAAIEYSLTPEISVAEIIDECVTALAWIVEQNANQLIILGGHSAGAHLALAVAARLPVDGLVLVSGIFDLQPIVPTTINEALDLTEKEAFALSSIAGAFPFPCQAEVLVGGDESPSFHAQAKAVTDYLMDNDSPVRLNTLEGLDHFDIILNGEHFKSFLRLTKA